MAITEIQLNGDSNSMASCPWPLKNPLDINAQTKL